MNVEANRTDRLKTSLHSTLHVMFALYCVKLNPICAF